MNHPRKQYSYQNGCGQYEISMGIIEVPYFIVQISFVSSLRYYAEWVCGWLSKGKKVPPFTVY